MERERSGYIEQEKPEEIDPREYFQSRASIDFEENMAADKQVDWQRIPNGEKFLFQSAEKKIGGGTLHDSREGKARELILMETLNEENQKEVIDYLIENSDGFFRIVLETYLKNVEDTPETTRVLQQALAEMKRNGGREKGMLEMVNLFNPEVRNDDLWSKMDFSDWTNEQGKNYDRRELIKWFTALSGWFNENFKDEEERKHFLEYIKNQLKSGNETVLYGIWRESLGDMKMGGDWQKVDLKRERNFSEEMKVERPINSLAELKSVLETWHATELDPRIVRGEKRGEEKVEMVPINKIVGRSFYEGEAHNFFITDSREEGGGKRGDEYLYQMVKAIQEGKYDPIKDGGIYLCEIGGNYYLGQSGNHRTVALMALGVKEFPAWVSHY